MFFIVASIALLLCCIWIASITHPVRATFGDKMNGAEEKKIESQVITLAENNKKTLKIGVYNIHRCRGFDGVKDVARVAALVKDLDLTGLYEVQGPGYLTFRGDSALDQAAQIARLNKTNWLFWGAHHKWLRVTHGNGILSDYPITGWYTENLPGNSHNNYRVLFSATLSVGSEKIKIFSAHLSRRSDRETQLEYVLERFCQHDKAILIGDLNVVPGNIILARLIGQGEMIDATADGEPTGKVEPKGRHDWILLRGLSLVEKHRVDSPASDHPLYWSEISLSD